MRVFQNLSWWAGESCPVIISIRLAMPLRVSRFYGQPYKGQQLNHPKNLKVLTGRSSHDCKLTETFSFPGSTFYCSSYRHKRHKVNLVPRAFPGTRLAWGLINSVQHVHWCIESKLQIYQLFTTKLNEKRPY